MTRFHAELSTLEMPRHAVYLVEVMLVYFFALFRKLQLLTSPGCLCCRIQKNTYGDSRDPERDRSPHFRPMHEERRIISDHKGEIRTRDHRYNEPPKGRLFK